MTATTRAAAEPLDLAVARECPADVLVVLRAMRTALYAALYPRADGSRHDRNCFNRKPNSSPTPCSPACRYATGAYLLAEDLTADEAPVPAREMGRVG